ncbi:hypothetical protein Hanom_Chr03g00191971 [Helianthus anomalus]
MGCFSFVNTVRSGLQPLVHAAMQEDRSSQDPRRTGYTGLVILCISSSFVTS